MKIIVVSTDPQVIPAAAAIIGIDAEWLVVDQLEQALEQLPTTLLVIDVESIEIPPKLLPSLDLQKIVTLGQAPHTHLKVALHLQRDNQSNYWTSVLLLADKADQSATGLRQRPGLITHKRVFEIAEKASNGLVALTTGGIVADASSRFIKTTGGSAQQVLGKLIYSLLGETQEEELENFIATAPVGSTRQFEFKDTQQTLDAVWLILGEITVIEGQRYLLGILRDISRRHQGELALREAGQKRRALFNAIPDGICILDNEFKIIDCNDSFATMHGYTSEQVIDQNISKFLVEDEWQNRRQHLLQSTQESSYLGTRFALHKKGHSFEVELHGSLIENNDQRIYIGILRVKEQLPKQLEVSNNRYQAIVGNMPFGICITDQQGRFLEVNEAYCKQLGFSREELLAGSIDEIVDNQSQMSAFYQSIIKQKTASARIEGELRNGHWISLEVYGTRFPASEPGAPEEVMIVHRDLTALVKAEQSSRDLSGKLARLIAATPLALIEIDLQRKLVDWNPAAEKLFGYTVEQAQQLKLTDITPVDRQHKVQELWNLMLKNPEPIYYLGQGVTRAKEIVECEWYITPILNSDGEIRSIFTLVSDITEKRQLELQIRQARKMEALGQLAGGIAHDFNNILTGILGYGDLAALHPAVIKNSKLSSYLSAIRQAGGRGRDLIRQMLNYSRSQPLELQTLKPEHVVDEVLDLLSVTLPSTVIVGRNFAANLPTIHADPTQLHQVVMNICINASDAMPEGHGTLKVTLSQNFTPRTSCHSCHQLFQGQHVLLSIEDNGTGIPQKLITEIFNPFFTTKEYDKGTGMGLAAADGIIHSVDGHVRVHSVIDEGTRFDVYLPISDQLSNVESEAEPQPANLPADGTLLLVDDEPSVLALLMELFSNQGYQVIGCPTGGEALKAFTEANGEIDLVISDYTMPGMTGVELARELQQQAPMIPVIICTGYMDSLTQNNSIPDNVRYQLQKPTATRTLLEIVQELLPAAPP
ncbi:MAG: PAS domain S-box protein [Immundisolibacteraceae bacterium]|nr:PAS domain S-box protein [Immundisolibacteraceae bacterium]